VMNAGVLSVTERGKKKRGVARSVTECGIGKAARKILAGGREQVSRERWK